MATEVNSYSLLVAAYKKTVYALIVSIYVLSISSCSNKPNVDINKIEVNFIDTSIVSFLDAIQDDSLSIVLNNQVASTDTSVSRMTLTKKNITFNLSEYHLLRDLPKLPTTFVASEKKIIKMKRIIPFSDSEKKYFDLISKLASNANFLSNKANFIYPSEGHNKPSQKGIAYSWGSKDFKIRQNPPGNGDSCIYQIHGLDCSGFLYQIFKIAGIIIPKGRATDQRKVQVLKKALLPYFGDSSTYKVHDMQGLPLTHITSGDILYFSNESNEVTHIGICLLDENNNLNFFEASGLPNNCADNLSQQKGVRRLLLEKKMSIDRRNYGVVRISLN